MLLLRQWDWDANRVQAWSPMGAALVSHIVLLVFLTEDLWVSYGWAYRLFMTEAQGYESSD